MTAPTYNPKVRMFYGTLGSSDSRITPAPLLNISTELVYSNDTIIGYNYVVNLTGQITAIDLSDSSSVGEFGIGSIIDHAHNIRKLLSQNGNILTVTNEYGSEIPILKAKGGILRSFDISDSPNNWINYVNYTATIEFQAIEFIGASWRNYTPEDCSNIFLSDNTYSKNNPGILDISKYKIKSFEDNWSFNFDENEAYNRIKKIDYNNNDLNIDNSGFTIEYSINAVGKNAYVYTNENTSEVKVVPAWEQAKNFVQYRLHHQVTNLINNVLDTNKGTTCAPTGELNSLNVPSGPGLMNGLGNYFEIFNEVVNCDVSESEGSFSVSYSAIVKRNSYNNYSSINTKHRVSKSYKTTNNNGVPVTNISIEGNIEGLVPGGLIRSTDTIQLPPKGSFFSSVYNRGTGYGPKYINAKTLLNQIYNDNDYNGGIGANGKRDLTPQFKDILGVTYNELGVEGSEYDEIQDGPHPISFNLTHDYINGTINYSVEYSSNAVCGRKHREISIQTNSPIPVYAQFDIPNGGSVPIFQPLNTITAGNVTVTVTGVDLSENGQPTNIDILSEFDTGFIELPVNIPLPGTFILTSSQHTKNPLDGSFTVTKSFICNTNGCYIN